MQRLPVVALIVCASFFALSAYRALAVEVHDVEVVGSKPTLVVEFGEGTPVEQLFTFPRDGMRSIAIAVWSERALTLDVELVLRRASPGETEVVASLTRTLSQPAGQMWHTFEFEEVRRARDLAFGALFRLRKVTAASDSASAPGTFGLMAFADDPLASARLFVGAHSRWGDLAFIARAQPATRLQRMVQGLEAQAPKDIGLGGVGWFVLLGTYGGLIVVVAALAIGCLPPQHSSFPIGTSSRSSSATSVSLLVFTLAIGGGLLIIRERVAIDLLRSIDTAQLESPRGIHGVFSLLEEPINGMNPQAIFAHPPSRITWHVTVPQDPSALKTAVALQRMVWDERSDGVEFNIIVDDGSSTTRLYSRFLNPGARVEDRAWVAAEVDLSPYAGRSVGITLETTPGPSGNGNNDWAMWAHPRIVQGR